MSICLSLCLFLYLEYTANFVSMTNSSWAPRKIISGMFISNMGDYCFHLPTERLHRSLLWSFLNIFCISLINHNTKTIRWFYIHLLIVQAWHAYNCIIIVKITKLTNEVYPGKVIVSEVLLIFKHSSNSTSRFISSMLKVNVPGLPAQHWRWMSQGPNLQPEVPADCEDFSPIQFNHRCHI